MAAKKPYMDAQGTLYVPTAAQEYKFRQPKGKDLVTIQRSLKSSDLVDIEIMAAIIGALSLDGLTPDTTLELDADLLLTLGGAITSSFRVFGVSAV